jgi:outer membrane protein OmpA-like peptidoglycan-associated protein|tara:strand:- start:599 stop:715 length:117 start_codon:yes stop_codon:yes gene_type:complete
MYESIETKVSDSYFDFDEEDLKELAQEIIDKYEWPFQE